MATNRKNTEIDISFAEAQDIPHRVAEPLKHGKIPKISCAGSTVVTTVILLMVGLVAFDISMEMHILSSGLDCFLLANATLEVPTCSPTTVNVSSIEYHSGHRARNNQGYSYCLPISGRKDTSFCTAADRMDLVALPSKENRCYASVLHMLLVEVYEELQASGKSPIIVFGSLLGAVRDASMIPFTEDADIGYSGDLAANNELHLALWRKGYHFFFYDIWRVCVAPTHPLAASLYDPSLPVTASFAVPYVDLYAMEQINNTEWNLEGMKKVNNTRMMLPDDKIRPFAQMTINGVPFDTVHDPKFFLVEMYGDEFMTPKPRRA
ncbi:hypothetical protein BBO99_00006836 [Phytophthora kernoviae]|uniref:Uncharacterized protein n=2 Tax=Phytophthora kernoviae TaxID=325452 RepID=A0A3R7MPB6_9STRA|nr:hypothetical protein G195_010051 [Phytophthora kernoviae 00238/432]KAG2521070.1 hypothetical protein JM16_005681 [Phytophthora kernoviae]KAG2522310.1 hypothetical protein JM18_006235 [Phytophthora kernoviae]RLN15287.1 hypothetical protein BBI17_006019 [Phytophthora kernoviae]RLN77336.1 hypothetical protein BBO99_00006836 [Phytophthora kernoviae]